MWYLLAKEVPLADIILDVRQTDLEEKVAGAPPVGCAPATLESPLLRKHRLALGGQIALAIAQSDMTVDQIVLRTGIPKRRLNAALRGEAKNVTLEEIFAIASLTRTSVFLRLTERHNA